MKIYKIIIQEGEMSYNQEHYIMAENFEDANTQAHKMLAKIQKRGPEDAFIDTIEEQFELEVVK